MTTIKSRLLAIASAVLLLAAVSPGSVNAGILESCEGEIEKYCAVVEPGHGRTISCLYAHETVLSPECGASFVDFGDVLDNIFFAIRTALATCAVDLEEHCSGEKFGQGRLLSCLNENKSDLTSECGALVTEFSEDVSD